MGRSRKMSRTTLEVLGAFMDDPQQERHGYELMKATEIKAGSMYPILQRLEDDGMVEASWEDIDPAAEGRPRRRYYRVTGLGQAVFAQEIKVMSSRLRGLIPGIA